MRIAQVAPLFESVPPQGYGGTERVVSYLTEELVRQGHEVTLFASGDSVTRARLVSAVGHSIRAQIGDQSWMAYHTIQMDQVAQMAPQFDILHFHTDYLHFPLARTLSTPHVTTMHGRLDLPELAPVLHRFSDCPLVSISASQRLPLPDANWYGTVHHGLPPDLYSCGTAPGGYFVFLGRISREKRLDRAIDIAERCGMRLYIAAKVDKADEPYYSECKPLLELPMVEYIGEVNERQKSELLEHANALLFPIDWPEPFGLVMIEAFACGTPVIAYRSGSVPEVMEDGVTGYIVDNQEDAVRAARRVAVLDRSRCRDAFDRRFTAEHMAKAYCRIYETVIAERSHQSGGRNG
jgi:glycosyltransferase involved in cell wall biosynthesis